MTQKKVSAVIYCVLLLLCVFVLGYLAGFNHPSAEVRVTAASGSSAPLVRETEELPAAEPVSGLIDLNTADQLMLETLPGIGSELAKRIIAYRSEIGEFISIEQIKDVQGIGDKRYEELKQMITVGGTS